MGSRRRLSTLTIALAVATVTLGAVLTACAPAAVEETAERGRTIDGKPDFSGIWQALNEAHWDLEAHAARPGMVTQPGAHGFEFAQVPAAPVVALGAVGGVPASVGVVGGNGMIPYTPEAQAIKVENAANWIDRDPEIKCYLPGIPRAMYMPYPFQIIQSTNKIQMAFSFNTTARTIHLDEVEGPPDYTYMGGGGDTRWVDGKATRWWWMSTGSTARAGSIGPETSTARRSCSKSGLRPLPLTRFTTK